MTNPFLAPMTPYPGLERYARSVRLARAGLELFLFDAGSQDAPPALLVHGLGDEADTWRHLIPALAARRRILAPDLPGFGRSSQPDGPFSVPFFAEVLLEALDVLLPAGSRAVWIGHSLGAIISHYVALGHPERVGGLVLLDGCLLARSRKLDLATGMLLVPGFGERWYNGLRRDPQAAYRSLEPFYAHLERLPESERAFLFQRVNQRVWSDGQRRAFFGALRSLARWFPAQQRDLAPRLAALTVPTLVLWGESDGINSIKDGRALGQIQPGTRLITIPNAGHDVQQENPQTVLAAIEAAL
jgi:pimeloyl-ACP methyl ester carboxylesterase